MWIENYNENKPKEQLKVQLHYNTPNKEELFLKPSNYIKPFTSIATNLKFLHPTVTTETTVPI